MITVDALKTIQGLTKKLPLVTCRGELAYVHSRWFVLEVPKSLISPDVKFDEDFFSPEVETWRTMVPEEAGEYAQAVRTVIPEDNTPVIKLIASCGSARIHPAVYDLASRELPEVSFHLHAGELPLVTIRSQGNLVGGVAQVRVHN